MARVDYTDRAGAYRKARTLPAPVLAAWADAAGSIAARMPGDRDRLVVDVGAGPGGFLGPLAEWFGAAVVAVELAAAMRDEARVTGIAARFPYVGGRAEQLPLADGVADVAWLSTVVHQFDDLDLAAAELRRVVRRDGLVLIRGFFGDMRLTGAFERFPGIERSAATFPTTGDVVARFGRAGFARHETIDVIERWTFELDAWTERVRSIRHTDSAFRPLTDDEFEAGVAAMHADHGGHVGTIVSESVLRLVVLGRGDPVAD